MDDRRMWTMDRLSPYTNPEEPKVYTPSNGKVLVPEKRIMRSVHSPLGQLNYVMT